MKLVIFTLTLLFFLSSQAQVRTNFYNKEPISERGRFQKDYAKNFIQVAPPDSAEVSSLQLAEKNSREIRAPHFAKKLNVNIDFAEKANWYTEGGFRYGKLNIVAKKATSLSVQFTRFFLPDNAEMYIYNGKGAMLIGPITSTENNKDETWGCPPLQGDSLMIEVKLPAEMQNPLTLTISTIAYGFKDIFSVFCCGFGQSAACEINVVCPLGANWANQRLGVARVIGDQGTSYFTGEMVMNTCGSNVPNMLTAWHTLDNFVGTWQFLFQYWSPTCNPSQDGPTGLVFNGAFLRASNINSDFALILLSQTPPANSNITYLGWNRSPVAATNTVGIHHPEGDVMKICSDQNAPVLTDFLAPPFNSGAFNWWGAHFQQGTVEPGSSGSPLFDQNQLVIGQLTGNPNTTGQYCAEQIGNYGRFDISWATGGTATTELRDWLDPNNTGRMNTATTNIANLGNAINLFITGPASFCSGTGNYSVNSTLPVTWTAVPSGIVQIGSPNAPNTAVTAIGNGQVTLTATVCGGQSGSTIISVGAPNASQLSIVSQGPNVCPNVPVSFGARYNGNCTNFLADGITNVNWTVNPTPNTITNNSGTAGCGKFNNAGVLIRFPSQRQYNVTISAQNACGTSGTSSPYVVTVNQMFCGGAAFQVFPNPSSGSVTVSAQPADGSESVTFDGIRVFDPQGTLKAQFKYNKISKINLNLNLKPGVYFIEVSNGEYREQHQISIQQ